MVEPSFSIAEGIEKMLAGTNKQGSEAVDHNSPLNISYVDVFRTIQGEGPYAGRVAGFLRLAGCNLVCPACDTDYTSNRRTDSPYNIAALVLTRIQRGQLVVVTGGEPFRQNLYKLLTHLKELFEVQIETNGTLYPDWFDDFVTNVGPVSVVVSPKTPTIHEAWNDYSPEHISWKYVVSANEIDPEDGMPLSVLGRRMRVARPKSFLNSHEVRKRIYIQPADEKNPFQNQANLEQAIQTCLEFDYRLCVQLQKVIDLP